MTTLKATIRDGRLEIEAPLDWPDGTEVEIHPLGHAANGDSAAMSPEEIARTLAAMEQIVPFDMTEAERAAWAAERQARIEREKAEFTQHADRLRGQWE
jgi:hypothetical protein